MPTSFRTPERYVNEAEIESSARSVIQIFKFNAVLECQTMLGKMAGDPAGTENWRRILNMVRELETTKGAKAHPEDERG